MTLSTPVALIFFRRPASTVKVMERIRLARPRKLLLACDGPRSDKPEEAELVARTRHDVEAMIDWDCDVLKNYSAVNEGLYKGLPRKLNWIFEQAEEAIVLEDDCVPDVSFFRFCEELLARYRDDTRVMHISGSNYQRGRRRGDASYYFSNLSHVWGWATWRRAWRYFDGDMSQLSDAIGQESLRSILPDPLDHLYWTTMFSRNRDLGLRGRGLDWDSAWLLSCWLQNGLTITPNTNLISNIGHDSFGSHQVSRKNRLMNIPTGEMSFPLHHPKCMTRDWRADRFTTRDVFYRGLLERGLARLTRAR